MRDGLYRHSGQMAPTAPLLVLVGGGFGGVVLAFIVSFVGDFIPWIGTRLLLIAAYLGGLSLINSLLLKKGKVRNAGVAAVLAGLVGCITWYGSWVATVLYFSGAWTLNPAGLYTVAQIMAENGVFQIKGEVIGTTVTNVFWLAELLLVSGWSAYHGFRHIRATPFCEPCGLWLTEKMNLGPFAPPEDEHRFLINLNDGMVEPLINLHPAKAFPFWEVEVRECHGCHSVHVAKLVQVSVDKEEKKKRKALSPLFLLSTNQADALVRLSDQINAVVD